MTKSFALAAVEANRTEDDDERLPFQIEGDDTQLYAYLPTEAQLVLIIAMGSELADRSGRNADVLAVFWELVDDETRAHLRRRLVDRSDPFGPADLLHIIEWLVEEATARPTQPPSDSTPSPTTNGQRSTARAPRRASTRSPSPRTGSAT